MAIRTLAVAGVFLAPLCWFVPRSEWPWAAPLVDVVVAHYNEDLSWVSQYRGPGVKFIIYSKGDSPSSEAAEILPNIGRESQTYLHHIVNNYNALAPWTVFTQGSMPAWGYRGGDSNSGHLTDNITFQDYLQPFPGGQESFFAISAACHVPKGLQSTRVGLMTEELKSPSNSLCPSGGADGWSSWWFDAKHPHHREGEQMLDFYHRYVLQDTNDHRPVTLGFAQGARFSVSRARIRARPREYYISLLRQVSQAKDPMQGYFMEAMWYDVFHPEVAQARSEVCPYPELPQGWGMQLEEMYEETARRLNAEAATQSQISPRSLSDAYVGPYVVVRPGAYLPTDASTTESTTESTTTMSTTESTTTTMSATTSSTLTSTAVSSRTTSTVVSTTSTPPTPKPSPTPAPTEKPVATTTVPPALTPAATPAPTPGSNAANTLTGSMGVHVPDATHYITPGPAQDALKSVWGTTISGHIGVPASRVVVDFAVVRRLAEDFMAPSAQRRLQVQLSVSYTITFHPDDNVTAHDTMQALASTDTAALQSAFVAALQAHPDVPQTVKDTADQIAVHSISVDPPELQEVVSTTATAIGTWPDGIARAGAQARMMLTPAHVFLLGWLLLGQVL